MLNLITKYIFWTKVFNRISLEKNRLWKFLPVQRIASKGISASSSKEVFRKCLEEMLGTIDVALFQSVDEATKTEIIRLAGNALDHNFDLLGSGRHHFDKIDWHSDFKSGFTWHKGTFYRKYRIVDLSSKADVKVPWELSRCHHLLWLGEAYLVTKEEKYAQEVVEQINNWIDENPLMYSINWTCAMDVAIRAVNWMFAVNMISNSSFVDDLLVKRLSISLYEHGFFIFNNLEKTILYSANHYASDIVGLLYLGQLFKDINRGKQWWNFALNEFYSEIRTQILPSGVHFEKSVSYHRLMTELFSYPIYMMKRVGVAIPMDITARVRSMYKYVAEYTKPNGNSPLIEDNDDGRFLPFMYYDFRNHQYLLDSKSIDNVMICCGSDYLFENNKKEDCSSFYEDAGFAILRKDDAYLFVTNGGESKYPENRNVIGTHTHNDLLSFDFALGKDDIIIDPGTYVYTADAERRNEFRSTKKHNTIVVDDEEQNTLMKSNMFTIQKNSRIGEIILETSGQKDICTGNYQTIAGRMNHKRTFELLDNKLVLTDYVAKNGANHLAHLFFHLSPNICLVVIDNAINIETSHFSINMSVNSTTSIRCFDDTISPSYGSLIDTKTIEVKCAFDEQKEIKTIIEWKKKK